MSLLVYVYNLVSRYRCIHITSYLAIVLCIYNLVCFYRCILQDYLRQGLPGTETTRARGLHKIYTATGNELLYPHSNAMTSTQYQKPVPTIYGPMKRPNVYGVDTQHNRHGFMSFDDHYF